LETLVAQLLNRPGIVALVRLAALTIPFQAVFTTSNSAFIGLEHRR